MVGRMGRMVNDPPKTARVFGGTHTVSNRVVNGGVEFFLLDTEVLAT